MRRAGDGPLVYRQPVALDSEPMADPVVDFQLLLRRHWGGVLECALAPSDRLGVHAERLADCLLLHSLVQRPRRSLLGVTALMAVVPPQKGSHAVSARDVSVRRPRSPRQDACPRRCHQPLDGTAVTACILSGRRLAVNRSSGR